MFTFPKQLANIFQNQKVSNIFNSIGIFGKFSRFDKFGNIDKSNRSCKVIFGIRRKISCEVGFN
jgi:hypothetical protein